ncbi:flap endonuclease-1 [Candidatus Bathyarchaeota archaeon]|nr:flap endonuclease-1 [Candidatus Bathyarchaeota archaeon]
MGVDLGDLIPRVKVSLDSLSGRSVAVDAYNMLYQFLSIIRGPSGEPLMDQRGRVTSHLSGLFYRSLNMAEKGLRLVYVFDGTPPALKEAELKARARVKDEALAKYREALDRGDMEAARRYAQMTARLRDEMVEDSKRLLSLLGIPWVQAPSEGEAQAAYMTVKGDVWAAASQDYDALLFGAPRLLRNLAVTGRRRLPKRDAFVEVEPELIELDRVLAYLGLSREQLVDLGILIGTDYNPGGVRGVGPRTALKLLKDHGCLEAIAEAKPGLGLPENYKEIRDMFLNPRISEDYRVEWGSPDVEGVVSFLCRERDFSEARVRGALEKTITGLKAHEAKRTLESYFG